MKSIKSHRRLTLEWGKILELAATHFAHHSRFAALPLDKREDHGQQGVRLSAQSSDGRKPASRRWPVTPGVGGPSEGPRSAFGEECG